MYIQKVLYICYHFSIPLVRSPLTFALYFLKYQFLSSEVIFYTLARFLALVTTMVTKVDHGN